MSYRSETDYVAPVAPPDGYVQGHATEVRRVEYRQNPLATVERLVVFIFSLIELLIVARILLLLVSAGESNGMVSFVYTVSSIFVAAFRGILGLNEVQSGPSAL